MTQRILSILVAAAVAMSVLSCVFMWQMLRSGREAQAALLESQREAMAALIAEIRAPREAVAAAVADEANNWRPLRVKLVDGAGQPVAGSVNGSGKPLNSNEALSPLGAAANEGVADLGLLPPGQYALTVNVHSTGESTSLHVLLGPGRSAEHTVECPTALPTPVDMRVEIEPPADLKADQLYYVLLQNGQRSRVVDGRIWNKYGSDPRVFLLDKSGKVLGEVASADVEERRPSATGFAQQIPADVPVREPSKLVPGSYQFILQAYAAETPAPVEEGHVPRLQMLIGDWLQKQLEVTAGGSPACRVGASEATFWQGIRDHLHPEIPRPVLPQP